MNTQEKLVLNLSNDQVENLRFFAEKQGINLIKLVEEHLLNWLHVMEDKFEENGGECPRCHLSGKNSVLKGMPLLEAEKQGFVKIDSAFDRESPDIDNTLYVMCPNCLWQGFPERD